MHTYSACAPYSAFAHFTIQKFKCFLSSVIRTFALFSGLLLANLSLGTTPAFETATVAGGCFWCTEADLEKAPGVISAVSGYAGGQEKNPTYKQVASGQTSHIESVQVTYDPALISYNELLEYFWRNIDPTDNQGQFVDRGPQYRPAIFFHNQQQENAAKAGFKMLSQKFDKPIVVELLPFTSFYPAEEYHQDYYKKSALKYSYYRSRSGRDDFIEKHWDSKPAHFDKFIKPDEQTLKARIGQLAFEVTQEDATEKPFNNAYWDNKEDGIYVDIISGEALFSSTDQFKSGTGWPSFTRPIVNSFVSKNKDYKLFFPRTEVRSAIADSHLGHVFDDGPEPTGLRYCINSASLRFIPKDKMQSEGYGHYLPIFESQMDAN